MAERTALESTSATWSYRELVERIGRVAGALRRRGLQRGERVGLLVERNLDSVAGLFGVMAAAGAVCPLEPRLAASDLEVRLKSADIDWVLADRSSRCQGSRAGDAAHAVATRRSALLPRPTAVCRCRSVMTMH